MMGKWIAQAAQLACLLEVSAPKPGNVNRQHDFSNLRYEDFLLSAVAIGPAMASAGRRGIGQTIWRAIRDTHRVVQTNSNLGIVLLLAPLAKVCSGIALSARSKGDDREILDRLKVSLEKNQAELTVDDARKAYSAIRMARAGGLGKIPEGDISEIPSITLLQAMALVRERDSIAREYTSGFAITFEIGYPALKKSALAAPDFTSAIVQTYLAILARVPDTLISRKRGKEKAEEVSSWAQDTLERGGVLTAAGQASLDELDHALRGEGHSLNPGTTADLTAAAIFLYIIMNRSVLGDFGL
jgi:triphosphoribosyl-dephospho-CoA synthase